MGAVAVTTSAAAQPCAAACAHVPPKLCGLSAEFSAALSADSGAEASTSQTVPECYLIVHNVAKKHNIGECAGVHRAGVH